MTELQHLNDELKAYIQELESQNAAKDVELSKLQGKCTVCKDQYSSLYEKFVSLHYKFANQASSIKAME